MQPGWSGYLKWLGKVPGASKVKAIFEFFSEQFARFSKWLKPRKSAFFDVMMVYRGAVLPAAGLALAFALFDQTHEIYLLLAEDAAQIGTLVSEPGGVLRATRLVSAFIGLGGFCVILWFNARWLSLRGEHLWWQEDGGGKFMHRSPEYRSNRVLFKQYTPRVLGALPAGGMAIGLIWTAFSDESGDGGVRVALILGALLALTIGGAFLRLVIGRRRGTSDYGADREMFDGAQRFGLGLFLVFIIVVAVFHVTPAQVIGPIGIFCLFGIGLSVILTWLTDDTDRRHIPWVSLLVALAIGLSVFDVNDNHRLDMAAADPPVAGPRDSFELWLGNRSRVAGEDFPVYVVAAQGGGLYAAYHTAIFLARAQDMNPAFADHLFAVSGVSGGSVGAAIFHAILESKACPRVRGDCHVKKVQAVLRRDFLSPVAASLLFTDFSARFLPFPGDWTSALSRARALEAGFAAALEDEGADPDAPLLGSWRPEGGSGPLLLLNTTDVNSGERMVMTPLAQIYENDLDHRPVQTMAGLLGCKTGDAACLSPRLLSAALVSARFPFVTPAARISLGPGADRRFVDGGYFENSGVETAQDLLLQIGRRDGVTFHLIAMDFPVKAGAERDRPHWLGEIMSPVRAFLNARGARGELAKRQAENWAKREQDGIRYHSATLDDRAAQFTLGWTLSARTFDQIEFEIWNDSSAGRLDKKCLEKEQVQNRELLAGMAGLPMPETGLSVCPQGR